MEEIMKVKLRELTSEQLREITNLNLSLSEDPNILHVSYSLEGDILVIRCERRHGMRFSDGPRRFEKAENSRRDIR